MAACLEGRGGATALSHQVSAGALRCHSNSSLIGWLIRTAIFTMVEAGIDAAVRIWAPLRSGADL